MSIFICINNTILDMNITESKKDELESLLKKWNPSDSDWKNSSKSKQLSSTWNKIYQLSKHLSDVEVKQIDKKYGTNLASAEYRRKKDEPTYFGNYYVILEPGYGYAVKKMKRGTTHVVKRNIKKYNDAVKLAKEKDKQYPKNESNEMNRERLKEIIKSHIDEGPSKSFNKIAGEFQKQALKHQELVNAQKKLADQFVKETDPSKKEKMKSSLIDHHKKVKAQEKIMNRAETIMMNKLEGEDYDLEESINELKKLTSGPFKGYDEHKGKVIIPLGVSTKGKDIGYTKMTVVLGIKTATQTDMKHNEFDFYVMNGKVVALLKANGKRRVKVRQQKDPNYLKNVIKVWKSAVYDYVNNMNESISEDNTCWDGYQQYGMKMKNGKEVPNCVPVDESEIKTISKKKWNSLPKDYKSIKNGTKYMLTNVNGETRLVPVKVESVINEREDYASKIAKELVKSKQVKKGDVKNNEKEVLVKIYNHLKKNSNMSRTQLSYYANDPDFYPDVLSSIRHELGEGIVSEAKKDKKYWKRYFDMAKDTSGKTLSQFEKEFGRVNDLPHVVDALEKTEKGEFDKFYKMIKPFEESYVKEGVMSDIHLMAKQSKNEDEFVNKFMKKYGSNVKKNDDTSEWLKSLYNDTKNENISEDNTSRAISYWTKVVSRLDDKFIKYNSNKVTNWNAVKRVLKQMMNGLPERNAGEIAQLYHDYRRNEYDSKKLVNKIVKSMSSFYKENNETVIPTGIRITSDVDLDKIDFRTSFALKNEHNIPHDVSTTRVNDNSEIEIVFNKAGSNAINELGISNKSIISTVTSIIK